MINKIIETRLIRKGKKQITEGKLEKAHACFQKAVILNNSTDNLFYLGLSLMSLARFEEARKYFADIQEKNPENELNLLSLAECNMMLRDWLAAERNYQQLTQQFPNNQPYQEYLQRSQDVVYREKYVISRELFAQAERALFAKDKAKALAYLLEAEQYNPNNPNILNNIGSLLMLQKKYQEAFPYIERAVTISPNNQKFQDSYQRIKRKLRK
ncbi:MAG: tetratricopeptide repeat protein [Candidatus Cloacimonadales bacterium]